MSKPVLIRVGAIDRGAMSLLRSLGQELVEVEGKAKHTGGSFSELYKKAQDGAAKGLGGLKKMKDMLGGISGIADTISKALGPALDLSKARAELMGMGASAEQAGALLKGLSQVAANNPLELGSVNDLGRKLAAAKVPLQAIPSLVTALGNAAGGNADKLGTLGEAYANVSRTGKLGMAELGTFTQANVPIVSTLASQFNIAENDVLRLAEQGALGVGDLNAALGQLTTGSGQLANGLGAAAGTISGKWTMLKNQMLSAAADIGAEILPPIQDAMQDILACIEDLRNSGKLEEWGKAAADGIKRLYEVIVPLIEFIREHGKSIAIIGGTMWGASKINGMVQQVLALRSALGMVQGTFMQGAGAAMSFGAAATAIAWGGVIAGVAALGVEIYGIVKAGQEASDALKNLEKDGTKAMGGLADYARSSGFSKFFSNIAEGLGLKKADYSMSTSAPTDEQVAARRRELGLPPKGTPPRRSAPRPSSYPQPRGRQWHRPPPAGYRRPSSRTGNGPKDESRKTTDKVFDDLVKGRFKERAIDGKPGKADKMLRLLLGNRVGAKGTPQQRQQFHARAKAVGGGDAKLGVEILRKRAENIIKAQEEAAKEREDKRKALEEKLNEKIKDGMKAREKLAALERRQIRERAKKAVEAMRKAQSQRAKADRDAAKKAKARAKKLSSRGSSRWDTILSKSPREHRRARRQAEREERARKRDKRRRLRTAVQRARRGRATPEDMEVLKAHRDEVRSRRAKRRSRRKGRSAKVHEGRTVVIERFQKRVEENEKNARTRKDRGRLKDEIEAGNRARQFVDKNGNISPQNVNKLLNDVASIARVLAGTP